MQHHAISGPFLKNWSGVRMDRARRLKHINVTEDSKGCGTVYAYAFTKVEQNVLGTVIDNTCKLLQV